MVKKTNIEAIKEIAISFLRIDIKEIPMSPIIVEHPIFENGMIGIKYDSEFKTLNILKPKEYKEAVIQYTNRINQCKNLFDIYLIIRKSYRLTFLKFIETYLSKEDFSEFLADAWVSSENPNQDVNCSLTLLTKWFKRADKKYLMNEDDYKVYCNLPDEIKIYRGVAVGRNPKGLSWTPNYEKAVWFANRFNRGEKTGFVYSAIIKKENVLAYFNTRGEEEIVANHKDVLFLEIMKEIK